MKEKLCMATMDSYATDIRRISIYDIKEAILEFGAVYKSFYYSNEIILTHK